MPVPVQIGEFKFGEDVFKFRHVVVNGDVRFVAKDIAEALKYTDCKRAIQKHVSDKYKFVYGDDNKPGGQNVTPTTSQQNDIILKSHPLYLQPHTVLINKSGVIELIMKSKLPYAVELQEWLLEEVIPQVLCTGKYQPAIEHNTGFLTNISEALATIRNDNQELKLIVAKKDRQLEQSMKMVHRVMGDMNRMYTGFQETLQKKDEQVNGLLHRIVDMSDRVVDYPVNQCKEPVLCIAREGTIFTAIAGQKPYVQKQKTRRNLNAANIVLERKRPNPTLDWNNAVHAVADNKNVKRKNRFISFDCDTDAEQFEKKLKTMLGTNK